MNNATNYLEDLNTIGRLTWGQKVAYIIRSLNTVFENEHYDVNNTISKYKSYLKNTEFMSYLSSIQTDQDNTATKISALLGYDETHLWTFFDLCHQASISIVSLDGNHDTNSLENYIHSLLTELYKETTSIKEYITTLPTTQQYIIDQVRKRMSGWEDQEDQEGQEIPKNIPSINIIIWLHDLHSLGKWWDDTVKEALQELIGVYPEWLWVTGNLQKEYWLSNPVTREEFEGILKGIVENLSKVKVLDGDSKIILPLVKKLHTRSQGHTSRTMSATLP